VPERAPLSVTFYLEPKDAELFASLHAAHMGSRYDERAHDELLEAGLLELEEFNPGPDGENMDDVRLSNAGARKMLELRERARIGFEAKRSASVRSVSVPSSPALDSTRRGSVPVGRHPDRGSPTGRASRPAHRANTHRGNAGDPPTKATTDGTTAHVRIEGPDAA
jgi:hypothetical protein